MRNRGTVVLVLNTFEPFIYKKQMAVVFNSCFPHLHLRHWGPSSTKQAHWNTILSEIKETIHISIEFPWYCWWKKSCTSWYGESTTVAFTRFYTSRVVQDPVKSLLYSVLGGPDTLGTADLGQGWFFLFWEGRDAQDEVHFSETLGLQTSTMQKPVNMDRTEHCFGIGGLNVFLFTSSLSVRYSKSKIKIRIIHCRLNWVP